MTEYQKAIFKDREKNLTKKLTRKETIELAKAMECWAAKKYTKALKHVGKINHEYCLEVIFYLKDFEEYVEE